MPIYINGEGLAKKEQYTSKSIRGECKNSGCTNKKQHGSAYCAKCSNKHKK